jgi:lipid II:glycine glycyltransferase (peptidoglycan interpeptide bridge formation enzyme)
MIGFATDDEQQTWDDRVITNPDGGNVFQGVVFADMKRRGGWTPRFVICDNLSLLVLEKSIPLMGKLWYLPKGPGVTTMRQLDDALSALHKFAEQNGVFLLKIEPELLQADETVADLLKLGFTKGAPIQPNFSTVLIDLSPDLETVLASLNQKGRHAIKRAERDGATAVAVEATDDNCRTMYELFNATAEGSFRIRSFDYYKAFWQGYAAKGQGQLFFAYVDGTVVAAAFALIYGKKSTYKDGASSRERTVYGVSHLLQWRVIEWAKHHGSVVHDLCGVPPISQIANPEHPHYGLGRFKTSFNKQVTEYVGVYELPISQRGYKLWKNIGERLVLSIHNRRYRENFY